MPKFTDGSLNKKLIEASETMPDKVTPKAYRNKMQGHKLWKEGYVSRVRVKPGITAGLVMLCLTKASVSASMERGIFAVLSIISLFPLSSISLFLPFPLHASLLDNLNLLTEQLTNHHYQIHFLQHYSSSFWSPFLEADFH